MTLMLGQEGAQLLGQFTQQITAGGPGRSAFWGEIITKTLPRNAVGPVLDRLQAVFLRHFGGVGGASLLGKAMPFGIGAAIGGTGNHLLGRRVVAVSYTHLDVYKRQPATIYPHRVFPGELFPLCIPTQHSLPT